jgi:adenosylcobinamide kinase / adenosylcobinamide-phosphate guanylyltransferase
MNDLQVVIPWDHWGGAAQSQGITTRRSLIPGLLDYHDFVNPRIILVGGGVRSGKSDFALRLARRLGPRRAFVATAQAFDDEMRARIKQHQRTRGPDFETFEEPIALPATLRSLTADVVVVDCLTLWLSNLMLQDATDDAVLAAVDELVTTLAQRRRSVILVTNEVGMGIVPETPLGRRFRDLAGIMHQRLAASADEVYFAVLGTMLRIKPTVGSADA